jgi:hypothetical protein
MQADIITIMMIRTMLLQSILVELDSLIHRIRPRCQDAGSVWAAAIAAVHYYHSTYQDYLGT